MTSSARTSDRFNHYRKQGWWPGERLEERYKRSVLARPGSLAVADSIGRALTHADLWQRAGELAGVLAEQGTSSGDVVLLYLPNRVEWQIALLAVLRLQAVPASIPTKTDASTLAYVADLVRCRVMLTLEHEHERGRELVETAAQAALEVSQELGVLCISADGQNRWVSKPAAGEAPTDPVNGLDHVLFTSSTTGLPKAVMHTADSLAALNILFTERFSLGPDRPIFMGSPLGHSVGGIHGARLALYNGAALILQETWDPEAALQLIEKYRCAFTVAATPFLKDLDRKSVV